MEFLKAQLARLQQQFDQLTASQKMLSVSLVAIMVMTLLWWGRYAGQPEMESVIDRDFTPEEVAHLTADLRSRGIPVSSTGSRVMVPADRKPEALGALLYSQSIPADSSSTLLLDIMAKATGPFSSDKQTDIAYNAAREAYMASIIRGFPGVQRANVAIAVPQHRTAFEDGGISATIDVHLKSGQKYDGHMATAVAEILTGGVPNLKRKDVHVVVDSKARSIPLDEGDGMPADSSTSMEAVAASESYYQNKLRDAFFFCDGITAHVSVELDNKTSDIHETKYDGKSAVSRQTEDTSDTTNSSRGGAAAGGDVGVAPNTGANAPMSIGGGGGSGESPVAQSSEKTTSKTQNYVPQTDITTHQRGGKATVTAASVMLPRSYFVKAYLHENHADKEPTPAIMDAYIKAMCTTFRSMVKTACDNPPDKDVLVDAYPDFINPLGDAPTQAVSGVSLLLSNHAKEISLGALAVISLFMVSMMVRKSGPAVALAGAAGEGGVAMIDGQPVSAGVGSTVDAIIGKAGGKGLIASVTDEVAEGDPMLDGVEVDDEALRSRQVAEQVVTLVKDNPDAAANLIKRWMNRT